MPALFSGGDDMNRLDDLYFNIRETLCVLKGKLAELYRKLTEF